MKLLFDHNLSPRLVDRLADLFPESTHVYLLDMAQTDDREVWTYAQNNRFTIVTRDSDFNELLTLLGFPPKVIWIRRGNCSTTAIESMLRSHLADIQNPMRVRPNINSCRIRTDGFQTERGSPF